MDVDQPEEMEPPCETERVAARPLARDARVRVPPGKWQVAIGDRRERECPVHAGDPGLVAEVGVERQRLLEPGAAEPEDVSLLAQPGLRREPEVVEGLGEDRAVAASTGLLERLCV
ncbi:MAG: hypothetical protein E6I94_10025 [Chloroflexi bacterium]|nr:MAG: hypothetical protein E6I94_10025 [Chloroflexota bacterium]